MTDHSHPAPLLAYRHDRLEFLTLHPDGRLILRHRQENGHLNIRVQNVPVAADMIQANGPSRRWVADIVSLPPGLFPAPNIVIALRGQAADQSLRFMVPFTSWNRAQLDALHAAFNDCILVINNGELLVHRKRLAMLLANCGPTPSIGGVS